VNLDVLDNLVVDFNRTDQQRDGDGVGFPLAVWTFAAALNTYASLRDGARQGHAVKQHVIRSDVAFVRLAVKPAVRVGIRDTHKSEAIVSRSLCGRVGRRCRLWCAAQGYSARNDLVGQGRALRRRGGVDAGGQAEQLGRRLSGPGVVARRRRRVARQETNTPPSTWRTTWPASSMMSA
jgi:hypothetical protein